MTKFAVVAFGAVLGLAGAYAMVEGYGIIEVERGWAAVIAGAVVMGTGCVIAAIGLLIGVVEQLRLDLLNGATSDVLRRDDSGAASRPATFEAAPPRVRERSSPTPETRTAEESTGGGPPKFVAPAPVVDKSARIDAPQDIAPAAEPSGTWIEDALIASGQAPPASSAPNNDEPSVPPKALAIVGRYAFGGANYALFEDGSIETQTATGVKRFASLAELREHIGESSKQG